MAGPNTLNFDDSNFEAEVLGAKMPVLVDFWAEWCMPCQQLAPTIDELAREYAGRVLVGKVDVDKAEQTAARYEVHSIPTVLVFQNGQSVERFVGLRQKKEYQQVLDARLGG